MVRDSRVEQVQELISAFRKIWADSWGVRMEDLLRHSLIALSEADLTLVELTRFLASQGFRQRVLEKVSHPLAQEYFQRFDTLTERARITWTEPVTNKVDALLADERIRQLSASPRSTFQLRGAMDFGKILLVKLDKGRLRDSGDLLGSLILAKIKMATFSRSDVPPQERRPFHLYIDEFQNFATDSFSVMLSEARKYGLSLVLAHQTLAQVPSELRSLILGNTGIQVYFRAGHQDAQLLANEAFIYSGHDVKSASLRGIRYRSPGEQRQLLAQEIQDLPPRVCYVKHKIEGGLIPIHTVDIDPPWEVLGVNQDGYQKHPLSLALGRKYLVAREKVERKSLPGRQGFLLLPRQGMRVRRRPISKTKPSSERLRLPTSLPISSFLHRLTTHGETPRRGMVLSPMGKAGGQRIRSWWCTWSTSPSTPPCQPCKEMKPSS